MPRLAILPSHLRFNEAVYWAKMVFLKEVHPESLPEWSVEGPGVGSQISVDPLSMLMAFNLYEASPRIPIANGNRDLTVELPFELGVNYTVISEILQNKVDNRAKIYEFQKAFEIQTKANGLDYSGCWLRLRPRPGNSDIRTSQDALNDNYQAELIASFKTYFPHWEGLTNQCIRWLMLYVVANFPLPSREFRNRDELLSGFTTGAIVTKCHDLIDKYRNVVPLETALQGFETEFSAYMKDQLKTSFTPFENTLYRPSKMPNQAVDWNAIIANTPPTARIMDFLSTGNPPAQVLQRLPKHIQAVHFHPTQPLTRHYLEMLSPHVSEVKGAVSRHCLLDGPEQMDIARGAPYGVKDLVLYNRRGERLPIWRGQRNAAIAKTLPTAVYDQVSGMSAQEVARKTDAEMVEGICLLLNHYLGDDTRPDGGVLFALEKAWRIKGREHMDAVRTIRNRINEGSLSTPEDILRELVALRPRNYTGGLQNRIHYIQEKLWTHCESAPVSSRMAGPSSSSASF